MTAKRLPEGGRIDRDRALVFEWDGKELEGFAGDTVASALLVNNEWVVGRSFKYHRPRGIQSAGVEESGALVTLHDGALRDPNVPSTTQELYAGLSVFGQNGWPSVRFDLAAVNDRLGRFFAAGFYYKTFMGWPPLEWGRGTAVWMWYEKLIRRAAGMGRASREPDPEHYEHTHAFCDVLIVGSGPAGVAAARASAEAGLDVWLVEQDSEPGGDGLNDAAEQQVALAGEVAALLSVGVRLLTRTTVFGLYDGGVAGLFERVTDHLSIPGAYQPRHRLWILRARFTIVASGAIERWLGFGDNDRPGIMTAGAARTYLNRYAVLPGERIIVATNNDSVYPTATELSTAGASVTVLDRRSSLAHTELRDRAVAAGVDVRLKSTPLQALGTRGIRRVKYAVLAGQEWRRHGELDADLVLVSGGWSPVVSLIAQRGVKPVWNTDLQAFLSPSTELPVALAGAAAGCWRRPDCIDSGNCAAQAALRALGITALAPAAVVPGGWDNPIVPELDIGIDARYGKRFVDLQHDVTADDITLAQREGFESVEHLKRYTTLGMAMDQGKVGNVSGLALLAQGSGVPMDRVGTTTFRPPYTPITLGALRGRFHGPHFRPLRRAPLHRWNLAHGATMTEAGLWHRPWYFAHGDENLEAAYRREASTVRRTVGLCDVTSLGKIAVQGPDASELLNRVYTNTFAQLPVGKARYGIMLRDDGMVMDDGTTWRLAEFDYFMTTTTAQASRVLVWLEELLAVRWPELRVHVTSVTDQWAGVSVAGPESRRLLQQVLQDPALVSADALPFMGVAYARLSNGIHSRIARISFSGELAYEVYVPSDFAAVMMNLLWPAAKALQGCLYGLEALGTLRIEKGHVTGAELDGNVTLEDAGLGRMGASGKNYVGKVLSQRPELMRVDRPRLVGMFPRNRRETFNAGSLLCAAESIHGHGQGWVSGVTFSPALGHWIGIGFIDGGETAWRQRRVIAADPVRHRSVEVEIVSPHMYDPDGARQNA